MFASCVSPLRYSLLTSALACLCASQAGAQSLTAVSIIDPAYGIKAFNISIPAGWKFEGTVLPMSAVDFLKHYVEMVTGNGMHVVEPMAMGAAYQQRVAGVGQNMNRIGPNIRGSADAAARANRDRQWHFYHRAAPARLCRVPDSRQRARRQRRRLLRACGYRTRSKGKLDTLCALVDTHDLVRTPHEEVWLQRVQQTSTQRAREDQARLTLKEQAGQAEEAV
jgi:hypothetical protein